MELESDSHILSKEETFHLRISHLLLRYGTTAIRVYFDQEFDPSRLGKELLKNRKLLSELKLSAEQFEKLFPKGKPPSSENFDITLMTLLLKHLTNINISDILPFDEDCSKEAAVSRIKYYRNEICHSNTGKISESSFHRLWDLIVYKSIVVLCPEMKETCEEFKAVIVDYSVKQRIQTLLEMERRNEQVIQTYQEFDTERKNLEEYQVQLKQSWKIKLQTFYPTKLTLQALEKLRNMHALIVVGCPGSGKSALGYHIAFFFEKNEGYTVIPLSSPEDIFRFRDKNLKQLFLFDDAFGSYSLEQSRLYKWDNRLEHFFKFGNTDKLKIILTCRSQIYSTKEVKDLKLIQTELHGNTVHIDLSLSERKEICRMYISENDLSLLDDEVISMYPFLPWICSAYENSNSDIVNFFKAPRTIIEKEIDRLKSHSSYFSLAFLVIFDNKMPKYSTYGEQFEIMLKDLFQESEFSQQPSKQSVISGFRNLKTMFIGETESYYYCMYDQVFDIIAHSVGSTFTKNILKYAHPEVISSRIQFQRFDEKEKNKTMISIENDLEILYYIRLLIFMREGLNWTVFGNVQCQYEEYRKDFLCFLKKRGKLLFVSRLKCPSAFYVSSYLGYYDFCKFIADTDFPQLLDVTEGKHNLLHHICYKGHVKIAALVIKKIDEMKKRDKRVISTLLCATGFIHLLLSQSFVTKKSWFHALFITLQENRKDHIINKCCIHNKSPLMFAIERNNKDIIALLTPFYVDVNRDIDKYGTLLHYACTLGNDEIAKQLIINSADVNRKRRTDGFTPLHCSCRYGHASLVKVLLSNNADINILSNQWTPLLEACIQSQLQIVEILIRNGASVNKIGLYNTTPLHAASMIGNTEITKLLLENKAEINLDVNGNHPLHIACLKGHVSVVVQLLKHCPKTFINNRKFGVSPLLVASSAGQTDVVSVLLDKCADVNFSDEKGITAIHLAVQNEFADVVEILLRNGAKINKTLHVACRQGSENLVKLLLSKSADVFEVDENLGTPLHETCGASPDNQPVVAIDSNLQTHFLNLSDNFIGIQNLLTYLKEDIITSDIEKMDNSNAAEDTIKQHRNILCLQRACYHNNISLVSLHLENGGDVNKTGTFKSTPLFIACLSGHSDVLKLLLEKDANINQKSIDGFTPLCAACFSKINKNVKLLLEASANVNCENNFGLVPLHIAVQTGNMCIVKSLLDYGANINKQTYDGQTALFIACIENRFDIVNLLLKRGANLNLPIIRNGSFTPLIVTDGQETRNPDSLQRWKLSIKQKLRLNFTPLRILCINDSNLQDVLFTLGLFWTFASRFCTKEYVILEDWLPSALFAYLMHHAIMSRCYVRPSFMLHHVCSDGNRRMVRILLQHKAHVNISFSDGKSPLYKACQNRHLQVANLLLMYGAEINKEDENGKTPLHIACEVGDRKIVKLLLRKGAYINRTDYDGQTPLYIAAQNANTDVLEILLHNKCCVTSCRLNGKSALHASCAKHNSKPVFLLLKYGSSINAIDHFGNSPLHVSCQYAHCNISELLIKHNAKLNIQNTYGSTPLHIACSQGNTDVVLVLLKWDADINIKDSKDKTGLYYACLNGFKHIVTLLLTYRQVLSKSDSDNNSCLEICFDKAYVDIAEMIIVRREILQFDKLILRKINSLFHCACTFGKYETAKRLLRLDASVNSKDRYGKTPLFKASENNHLQIVKLLLCKGANINSRNVDGMTPLFVACKSGHKMVVEYLITQQADLCQRDNDNITPYDVALLLGYTDICHFLGEKMKKVPESVDMLVYEKYSKLRKSKETLIRQPKEKSNIKIKNIVKIFLDFKGLIDRKDKYGRTPLHRACIAGRLEIVKQLLENGATFSKDVNGQTSLHFACSNGFEKIVNVLLRYGIKVNQKDLNGITPLDLSCFGGYANVAEILIKANADVDSLSYLGTTPLLLSIIRNHQKVLEVLLKHGASVNKINRYGQIPFTAIGIASMYKRFGMVISLLEYNGGLPGSNYFSYLSVDKSFIFSSQLALSYSRL